MTTRIFLLSLLALLTGCGKFQQVQDSFAMFGSGASVKLNDVRIGSFFRNDATANPSGYDYLIYENTQYRIGTIPAELQSVVSALPKGLEIPVYFKGTFTLRSGVVATNPNQSFDVVDITALTKK